MKVTVDTNVLVRVAVEDDPVQAAAAQTLFAGEESLVVTAQALCEFVWVLAGVYKRSRTDIATAIRALADMTGVILDRAGMEAGLSMLERGGDFADGVIVFEGRELGAMRFVSFDRRAVKLAVAAGFEAEVLR